MYATQAPYNGLSISIQSSIIIQTVIKSRFDSLVIGVLGVEEPEVAVSLGKKNGCTRPDADNGATYFLNSNALWLSRMSRPVTAPSEEKLFFIVVDDRTARV
jgi:hypothetical protein